MNNARNRYAHLTLKSTLILERKLPYFSTKTNSKIFSTVEVPLPLGEHILRS